MNVRFLKKTQRRGIANPKGDMSLLRAAAVWFALITGARAADSDSGHRASFDEDHADRLAEYVAQNLRAEATVGAGRVESHA